MLARQDANAGNDGCGEAAASSEAVGRRLGLGVDIGMGSSALSQSESPGLLVSRAGCGVRFLQCLKKLFS
jgi:hypothetical protein